MFSKYATVKDATELMFDGPNIGLTPFGGLTHLLARQETSLKYPGLSEFVMLTGTSLYAGDALRLGWTDLFTSIEDLDYHIKAWFDASEHMHNDAIAWQLGHLLDSTCRMREHHSGAIERSALNAVRARWIEDAFADQPSVEAILETLSQIETLPLTDKNNTCDASSVTPFTVESVALAVEKLQSTQLQFSIAPWDATELAVPPQLKHAGEIFTSYVLERREGVDYALNANRAAMRRWRDQRYAEYNAFQEMRECVAPRHVTIRLEGCEGRLVSFDFDFKGEKVKAVNELSQRSVVLEQLKKVALRRLGMPEDRSVEIGWFLPTLDTCPIHSDADLWVALQRDPGIMDPKNVTAYPPLYLILKRSTLYLSEWAYAVKHQMLLQSPFAMKASLELLKCVRGDGAQENVLSLSKTLAMELRFIARLLKRPDFYAVGQQSLRSLEEWREHEAAIARDIHRCELPLRPVFTMNDVFEKDVELHGHRFLMRPRWSPRTLAEVTDEDIRTVSQPLEYAKDGAVEIDVPTFAAKWRRIDGMIHDAGLEVISGLGEKDSSGAWKVPPSTSDAKVPTDVDFYQMARHPWNDTPSSWRQDGFTKDSMEYFEKQFKLAEQEVYDPQQRGVRTYWPTKDQLEGSKDRFEQQQASLLQDRLWGPIEEANKHVEGWARDLRRSSTAGKLHYPLEIATQEEKIYDDEFYRWFIEPGVHPNPSGLIFGRKESATKTPSEDLSKMLSTIHLSTAEDVAVEEDVGVQDLHVEAASPDV
jgi:hypothetical protein